MISSPQSLNFPERFSSWRSGQEQTIIDLCNSSTSINVLSAPTGSGKTAVAIAYARSMNYRFVYLTQSKQLQDQVVNDFAPHIADLRGRANYECISLNTPALNCATAPCLDGEPCIHKHNDCLYDVAEQQARSAPWGFVTNYAKWLTTIYQYPGSRNYDNRFGPVDLLICDEGHNIDNQLTERCAVDLDADAVQFLLPDIQLPFTTNDQVLRLWAQFAYPAARLAYSSSRDPFVRDQISQLGKQLSRLCTDDCKWVIDSSTQNRLRARPLWPDKFINKYLISGIARVLILSATITEPMIDRLGIDKSSYTFHRMASNFPPERRPFVYVDREPSVRLNHKTSKDDKQKLYDRVSATVRNFRNHNGVIHSVSHNRTNEICNMLRSVDGVRFFLNDPQPFVNCHEPSFLISASVTEGVDFRDDLTRCNLLPKVPYPSIVDPLIKARMKDDSSHYPDLAALAIMQIAGRGMRHDDDWCVNVCYDAAFVDLLRRAHFEPWFLETIEYSDEIPQPLNL